MEYRRLGKTGLKVSVLSFGAWVTFSKQLDVEAVKKLLTTAKDAGVNFWDNAEGYEAGDAEKLMGQAFKELGWKRSDHVVSTKIFFGTAKGPNDTGLSRKHIIEGTKASLARLQLDYVDLLFCHRPDPNTPIEETVRAMNFVIEKGWALYWGTSEWSAEQIKEATAIADRLGLLPPHFEQPEYNLFRREKVEKEFESLYTSPSGLGLTTWSPLASGILTGKYSGGVAPPGSRLALDSYTWLKDSKLNKQRQQVDQADLLKPIAKELDCSLAQLALAWCAKNPHVSTVILGATKVEQLVENLKALEVLPKLTPEIVARIEAVVKA